jgi:hypothetical protein
MERIESGYKKSPSKITTTGYVSLSTAKISTSFLSRDKLHPTNITEQQSWLSDGYFLFGWYTSGWFPEFMPGIVPTISKTNTEQSTITSISSGKTDKGGRVTITQNVKG